MLQSTKEAYYEIDTILNFLDKSYVKAIPLGLREKFKKNKAENYNKKIVPYKQLNEQNLKKETLAILAVLNLKYWCKDAKQKKQLTEMYAENEKKYQDELREKYNTDNLFKKNNFIENEVKDEEENINNKLIVLEKENIFKRIINKIKFLFRKH